MIASREYVVNHWLRRSWRMWPLTHRLSLNLTVAAAHVCILWRIRRCWWHWNIGILVGVFPNEKLVWCTCLQVKAKSYPNINELNPAYLSPLIPKELFKIYTLCVNQLHSASSKADA